VGFCVSRVDQRRVRWYTLLVILLVPQKGVRQVIAVVKLIVFLVGVVLAAAGYFHDPRVTWMIVVGAILVVLGGGRLVLDFIIDVILG
jgi:hypothetical protein